MDYSSFLLNKKMCHKMTGFDIDRKKLPDILFEYQKDLVQWSLKLGKSALFTMTGTGKTIMQLTFANEVYKYTNFNALIITPLGVTNQTILEAKNKLNIDINNLRKNPVKAGINIINYEMLDHVNSNDFGCVILDESSILKNYSGKIRNEVIDKFKNTAYKLCCTATPSPNDFMELGNHSEFLDILKRKEMLAMFFVHDSGETQTWRLKRHAQNDFWKWVSSWASVMIDPADLGYDNSFFKLPKLNTEEIIISTGIKLKNALFVNNAETLEERRDARKLSLDAKIKLLADKVNRSDEIHLIWCDLNVESELAKRNIKDCYEVKGSDPAEYKEKVMLDFAQGNIKCLVSKSSIMGFGMNFQICHNMHFLGLSDSFESYFQAVRRCWRFGQKNDVNVYIYTSDLEGAILENIKRKENDMNRMLLEMRKYTKDYVIDNIKHHTVIDTTYTPNDCIVIPKFIFENIGVYR